MISMAALAVWTVIVAFVVPAAMILAPLADWLLTVPEREAPAQLATARCVDHWSEDSDGRREL
jgi:hypothetical protein